MTSYWQIKQKVFYVLVGLTRNIHESKWAWAHSQQHLDSEVRLHHGALQGCGIRTGSLGPKSWRLGVPRWCFIMCNTCSRLAWALEDRSSKIKITKWRLTKRYETSSGRQEGYDGDLQRRLIESLVFQRGFGLPNSIIKSHKVAGFPIPSCSWNFHIAQVQCMRNFRVGRCKNGPMPVNQWHFSGTFQHMEIPKTPRRLTFYCGSARPEDEEEASRRKASRSQLQVFLATS